MRRLTFVAAGVGMLALQAVIAQAQSHADSDARKLEERLHAPCCREQLLEAHDSGPARALRLEIRTRLERGESSISIEGDLKQRYGGSIVAIPREHDPRSSLSIAFASLITFAAVGIALLGMRWVRGERLAATNCRTEPTRAHDELDSRIDAELRNL